MKGDIMGVRFQRTAVIASGKRDEAMQFAAEVSSYIGENFDTEVIWGIEVGGRFGKLYWFADYQNMGELEEALGKTMADEGYLKLVDDAADLFLAGETRDTFVYTM